jgi:hypothetical protein
MKRRPTRPSSLCRRSLARELARLRDDFERIAVSPDFARRVRAAVRRERRGPRDGSVGRLGAIAALALLSLVAGSGFDSGGGALASLHGTPPAARSAADRAEAPPSDVDPAPLLARLRSATNARERLSALTASAALLPEPPDDVVEEWRRLAHDDRSVAVRASASTLLEAWEARR